MLPDKSLLLGCLFQDTLGYHKGGSFLGDNNLRETVADVF